MPIMAGSAASAGSSTDATTLPVELINTDPILLPKLEDIKYPEGETHAHAL